MWTEDVAKREALEKEHEELTRLSAARQADNEAKDWFVDTRNRWCGEFYDVGGLPDTPKQLVADLRWLIDHMLRFIEDGQMTRKSRDWFQVSSEELEYYMELIGLQAASDDDAPHFMERYGHDVPVWHRMTTPA